MAQPVLEGISRKACTDSMQMEIPAVRFGYFACFPCKALGRDEKL